VLLLITIYVAALVAANLIVYWLGPWIAPINAFFLIGLDLTLRDVLHERTHGSLTAMAVLIATASLTTYLLNPAAGRIAFASMAAFSVSAVADWLTYSALAGKRYQVRVNGSNVVGAAVDSVLFPLIAFGAFLPGVMLGQWVAKVAGGALWAIVLNRRPFWRRA